MANVLPQPTSGADEVASTPARFLDDVAAHAPLPSHVPAVEAAVAVLSALLRRLTPGQAHRLVDSMPEALGPYFENVLQERDGKPVARLGRAELVAELGVRLSVTPATAESVASAVFAALRALVPQDVQANVAAQLPHDLQGLWLRGGPAVSLEAGETDHEARHRFLETLGSLTTLPDGVTADDVFSAVMCAFAQRLSGGEAEDLLLGLPRTLRPLVTRCFRHPERQVETFGVDTLVARVAEHLQTSPQRARELVTAVFGAVRAVLPADQVQDAASQLPPDLRDLWSGP